MTRKSPSKLLLATAVCLVLSALTGATAFAAKAPGKGAATVVTIENWPDGLKGKVSSDSGRCAEGRRVVVYRAGGSKPAPKTDQRIGTDRAQGAAGQFGWALETEADGRLNAQAPATKSCAAALSPVINASGLGGSAADPAAYPICGTYISETSSRICRIENLIFKTFAFPGEITCIWSSQDAATNCNTFAGPGPFPWVSEIRVGTSWKKDGGGRSVSFSSPQWDRPDVIATFEGRLPDLNSQRFTVTDAYAPDEGIAAPGGKPAGGDHFYTPELPGTSVGEVGGPLKMEVGRNEVGGGLRGTTFTLNGYLYLKR